MEKGENPRINDLFNQIYLLSTPVMVGISHSEILNPSIYFILKYLKKNVDEINIDIDRSFFLTKWNYYTDFVYRNFIHYNYDGRVQSEQKQIISKMINLIDKTILNVDCEKSLLPPENTFDIFYDGSFQNFLDESKKIKKGWDDKLEKEYSN